MSTTETRIKSSQLSDFEALGVSGEPIYRASSQILTLIEKELGIETASIFATPIRDDKNNIVDWYSSINGEVKAYKNLSEFEKSRIWNILNEEFSKVKTLSNRLLQNVSNETSQTYGRLLQSIQNFPSSEEIFVIGKHPVITFWGFKHHGEISQFKAFSEIVKKPSIPLNTELNQEEINPTNTSSSSLNSDRLFTRNDSVQTAFTDTNEDIKIPPPFQIEGQSKGSWWRRFGWWIFLILLLIVGVPSTFKACSSDFPLYDAKVNCQTKENKACSNPDLPPSMPILDAPPLPQEPTQTPKFDSTPQLTPSPLNKDSLEKKDLNVFNGKWSLITELQNAKTGENIKVDFEFDAAGKGRTVTREKNGNECIGTAEAHIQTNKRFDVDMSKLECKDGRAYVENRATCEIDGATNHANCYLKCANGPCDATFEKR